MQITKEREGEDLYSEKGGSAGGTNGFVGSNNLVTFFKMREQRRYQFKG